MPTRRTVIVLYEDAERTMKLIEQMSSCPQFSEIKLQLVDAGFECGIIAPPSTGDKKVKVGHNDVLFSRCSGSYLSRGHHQSPLVIESVIFAAEHCGEYCVLNGCKAFRLEMNKMLAFLHVAGDKFQTDCMSASPSGQSHLQAPPTVAVTRLEPKIVQNALIKNNIRGECFVKGIVGGGSTTVRRLMTVENDNVQNDNVPSRPFLESQLASIRAELDPQAAEGGISSDIFLIQQKTPSTEANCQYRFEIINKRVHYVVKICQHRNDEVTTAVRTPETDSKVDNLCMCDLETDDPNVELTIIKTPIELSKELGMQGGGSQGGKSPLTCAKGLYAALELFAREHDLHVVALEGTLHQGILWTFDINTNSNYNHKLEQQYGVVPGSWRLLQTMMEVE